MAKKIARNRKEVVTSQDPTPWPIAVQESLNSLARRVSDLEAQIERPEALFRGSGINPASMRARIEISEARLRKLEEK